MSTFSTTLRAGLPRVSGGDPWPPEGTVGQAVEWESREWVSAEGGAAEPGLTESGATESGAAEAVSTEPAEADVIESGAAEVGAPVTSDDAGSSVPEAGPGDVSAVGADDHGAAEPGAEDLGGSGLGIEDRGADEFGAEDSGAAVGGGVAAAAVATEVIDVPLRRGLPRVSGGDSWPPEGVASVRARSSAGSPAAGSAQPAADGAPTAAPEPGVSAAEASEQVSSEPVSSEQVAVSESEVVSSASDVDSAQADGVAQDEEAPSDVVAADATQPTAGAAAGVAAGAGVAGAGIAAASSGGAAGEDALVPLRRGLPRQSGGDPWPPEGFAPAGVKSLGAQSPSTSADGASAETGAPAESGAPAAAAGASTPAADSAAEPETTPAAETSAAPAAGSAVTAGAGAVAAANRPAGASELSDVPLRRGLPRTSGGDPWPPEGFAPVTAAASTAAAPTAPVAEPAAEQAPAASSEAATADTSATDTAAAGTAAGSAAASATADDAAGTEAAADKDAAAAGTAAKPAARSGLPKTRTGLPKSTGPDTGKPGAKPAARTGLPKTAGPASKPAEKPAAQKPAAATSAGTASAKQTDAKPTEPAKASAASAGTTAKASTASTKTAEKPKTAEKAKAQPAREPIMIGSKSLGQWGKLVSLGLGGLIVVGGILILAARGVTTLPGVPEFLERYPGEYHLPDFVEPGFPAWARWTHFLNLFFMVLIIRTGLQVRHQQKPPAFYTPKKGGKKISINLWLHTSLDVLWLINGVVFVVLLFASGHWARIVPTSWEVFPNALSAMLQYATLEWPMEDAWVNYNALQQLMYFIVVFIAAPLAAITGVRMSEWWPKDAATLNKIYPAPLARAIHFPTMLFFVFFIAVHVFLVFATGLRQNLGYMFAGTNVLGWAGVIWFIVAMVVVVAGWFAARPLLLAPIANLFGRVSSR
ncbi:cytochrome b/b6 domain-containing protein [Brevibacterium casei]|uniref:cytochrome b/b6 domain-containing protein n=1 Tax=Brevibacterium casei TaxID=33889 RepID=UPI00119DD50B|nr:cytochrome b/b6 domain-containing protein [Brevibacterium casei]